MATVLVAEDDPDVALLLTVKLEQAGHAVLTVHDGRAALATALAERPDLALLDNRMPVLTGLQVCRALKADPATAGIHVIFLTGCAEQCDIDAGLAAGAAAYLAKPFGLRELMVEVAALLAGQCGDRTAKANSAARLSSLATHAAYRSHPGVPDSGARPDAAAG